MAGAGGATLAVGSSYLAQTTTLEERQLKLGRYRISQNIARTVGPFVGCVPPGRRVQPSPGSTRRSCPPSHRLMRLLPTVSF